VYHYEGNTNKIIQIGILISNKKYHSEAWSMLENKIGTQKDLLRAMVLSYIYQVTVTANRKHKSI
jgi:hypothetical protein